VIEEIHATQASKNFYNIYNIRNKGAPSSRDTPSTSPNPKKTFSTATKKMQ